MKSSAENFLSQCVDRRSFVTTVGWTMGATFLLPATTSAQSQARTFTVGQVIDLILKEIPGAPFPKTVDTLKTGTRDQKVTGIVTTTFPTEDVIRRTAEAGANFLIVHEPSFYNHLDETAWLENDEVYRHKAQLLQQHSIAVWRFHDYWHAYRPDGILTGVLAALDWTGYQDSQKPGVLLLPSTTLSAVIAHVKQKFAIPTLRYVGDLAQPCRRVLLMPGASGGRRQIEALQREKPDVLICGEVSEWETPEYVRDARSKGDRLALVVLGHQPSEEPGMQYLVSWLQPRVPGVKVSHVPARNAFTWM